MARALLEEVESSIEVGEGTTTGDVQAGFQKPEARIPTEPSRTGSLPESLSLFPLGNHLTHTLCLCHEEGAGNRVRRMARCRRMQQTDCLQARPQTKNKHPWMAILQENGADMLTASRLRSGITTRWANASNERPRGMVTRAAPAAYPLVPLYTPSPSGRGGARGWDLSLGRMARIPFVYFHRGVCASLGACTTRPRGTFGCGGNCGCGSQRGSKMACPEGAPTLVGVFITCR